MYVYSLYLALTLYSLYGNGENEEMLGVYFKQGGKRDKIFLATKFGYTITDGKLGINSTAAYARQACEASMKRMGIDCIDLCKCPEPPLFAIASLTAGPHSLPPPGQPRDAH